SEGRDDIENVTELGVSRYLPAPSYQLDRGTFENFLGAEVRTRGIECRDATTARGGEIGDGEAPHCVPCPDDAGEHPVASRRSAPASGRAGLLRRRLDLTRDNGHHANAVWFRVDARIDMDQWSDDAEWRGRCHAERWRSTNH